MSETTTAAFQQRAYRVALATNGVTLGLLLFAVGVSVWAGEWDHALWRTLLLLVPACTLFAVVTARAITERHLTALDILIQQRLIERDTAHEFLGKFRRGEFVIREVSVDDPYAGRKPS
jgi:hypothetical protein